MVSHLGRFQCGSWDSPWLHRFAGVRAWGVSQHQSLGFEASDFSGGSQLVLGTLTGLEQMRPVICCPHPLFTKFTDLDRSGKPRFFLVPTASSWVSTSQFARCFLCLECCGFWTVAETVRYYNSIQFYCDTLKARSLRSTNFCGKVSAFFDRSKGLPSPN